MEIKISKNEGITIAHHITSHHITSFPDIMWNICSPFHLPYIEVIRIVCSPAQHRNVRSHTHTTHITCISPYSTLSLPTTSTPAPDIFHTPDGDHPHISQPNVDPIHTPHEHFSSFSCVSLCQCQCPKFVSSFQTVTHSFIPFHSQNVITQPPTPHIRYNFRHTHSFPPLPSHT